MADLAGAVLLSLSGVTRLVERLERAGMVAREPCQEDRRGANAVLTGPGLELVGKARETHRAGVERLFLRHFSPEELDDLGAFWQRLLTDRGGTGLDEGRGEGGGCGTAGERRERADGMA